MAMTLTVYVSERCWVCGGVPPVLARVRAALPDLPIVVVDVDREPPERVPPVVFSVPTYTLAGTVVSLGNPPEDFVQRLRDRMAASSEVR